jgi:hypothetical protein
MGHDFGEALVMVAFDPDDFHVSLGIRELADVAEKFPVFFGKTAEVEVGKDVAQQDQSPKQVIFQNAGGVPGTAAIRPQMQVGEDQRVVNGRIHAPFLVQKCYGVMKAE